MARSSVVLLLLVVLAFALWASPAAASEAPVPDASVVSPLEAEFRAERHYHAGRRLHWAGLAVAVLAPPAFWVTGSLAFGICGTEPCTAGLLLAVPIAMWTGGPLIAAVGGMRAARAAEAATGQRIRTWIGWTAVGFGAVGAVSGALSMARLDAEETPATTTLLVLAPLPAAILAVVQFQLAREVWRDRLALSLAPVPHGAQVGASVRF